MMDVTIDHEAGVVFIDVQHPGQLRSQGIETVRTTNLAKHGVFFHWGPPGVLARIEIHKPGEQVRVYGMDSRREAPV